MSVVTLSALLHEVKIVTLQCRNNVTRKSPIQKNTVILVSKVKKTVMKNIVWD